MASLLNGLSQMGASVSQFAGAAGLEQQKADLERQQTVLADQLATTREHAGRVEAGDIAATAQAKQNTFTAAQQTQSETASMARTQAEQGGATARSAAEIAGHHIDVNAQVNAEPPEVRQAKWFSTATPDQRAAYQQIELAKAGIPPGLIPADTPPTQPAAKSPAAAPPVDGSTDGAGPSKADTGGADSATHSTAPAGGATNVNPKALEGLSQPIAATVKAMVDGRLQPPSSMALSKPYWQAMVQKAAAYDPTFDQTTWAGRVATRKDFTSGQSAKAVTALNTALGHAGVVTDSFDKLDNFGGMATPLNAPVNFLEKTFGDSRQTNAQTAVSALASEARKVFAASGGGNLTELESWEKNFPVNGSPDQQKGAMKEFVNLLDSRLSSLSDQYNRGMTRTDDPLNLLEPHARQVYEQLTGRKPENATGYQSGSSVTAAIPGSGKPLAAPADPGARESNKAYLLPNGQTGTWTGAGWAGVH